MMTVTSRSRLVRLLPALLVVLVGAGCSPDDPERVETVPDVIGVQLSDAYDGLKSTGFLNIAADDLVADRSVIQRRNWVVIKQSLAPGQKVPRNTDILLSVAKPSDDRFDALLAAAKKPSRISQSAPKTGETRTTAPTQSQSERSAHNACSVLIALDLDTDVFTDQLEAPLSDTSTTDGVETPTYACANQDSSLGIEITRTPSQTQAREDASFSVQSDDDGMLVGPNGFKVTYPTGGGYSVNPDTGVARQAFTAGAWVVLVEAYFDDTITAQVQHKASPVDEVLATLDQMQEKTPKLLMSGRW